MASTINRRDWFRQTSLATLGLGFSFRSFANEEEGLPKNVDSEKGIINLSSNENPYGISPKAKGPCRARSESTGCSTKPRRGAWW